ncbi:MAG TPA: hypothetical protein VIL66_04290 [Bacillota bacterium]
MIRAVQKASKGLMQFGSVFFRIALFMIAVVIAISPIKEVCVAQIGRLSNRRIEQVIANDGFYNQSFSKPKYNVEARFAPDFITVKCVLDFEVQKEFKGFLPLMLYEGFQFDSVKYNEEDLPVKYWFKREQVKCWRVYLPRLKAGDDVQLFLIYSGKAPVAQDYLLYSSAQKWYPQPLGLAEGVITFRCIIDQEWEPYFSGFSTPVVELKEDVKLHEYLVSHPFSLLLINKHLRNQWQEEELRFWTNRALADGERLLLQQAVTELNTYYTTRIGDLPEQSRYYLITDKEDTQTRANLYSAVIGFKGKDQIRAGESGAELKNDFIFELAAGLAQAWWGGAVRPEGSGGAALLTGLTAYNAYLATKEVYSPEAASGIIDKWYERYLLSKQKFLWYEKPLSKITPCLDWQQQLAECKTPLVLHALSFLTGEEVFLQILKEIYQEYAGGTVTLEAFRAVAERISGLDLQWFFAYFFENAFHLDLEIVSCASQQMPEGYRTTVHLSGVGNLFQGQVDLEIQTETETIRQRIDLAQQGEAVAVETKEPVQVVWLDPDARWPDLNRKNNLWRNE